LAYALVLGTGVFGIDRLQRRRLIRAERERTRERELEQAREIEKAYRQLEEAHSHLKSTQSQLIQSEKMASLGELTAGIAHEIKNPLNFVNNFAELNIELTGELFDHVDAKPDLSVAEIRDILTLLRFNSEKISTQGKRVDGIVKSMIEHAQGGTGERVAIDVNELLEEYLGLAYNGMRAHTPEFEADIKREFGSDVGTAKVIPRDIGRVVINLLNNAFYAVHERAIRLNGQFVPTVTVSTRRLGTAVEIRVADNGSGIPAELMEKIFEPFFSTKPTGSGTGLGLSLSYDIITQGHGGRMAVESTEGEGSTFIIELGS
jgi:signal transduction histidine kinase